MVFSSPYALFFLLGIIPIIIIYMLKQKFRETEVSSIYLWYKVLKEIQADTPFQKLKKNLLMFLQIIIIILITFAIVNPLINMKDKVSGNLIIAVDNTASMKAKYKNETIMDYAKDKVKDIIRNSADNTKFTIIEANENPKVIAVGAKKNEALGTVSDIEAVNKTLNKSNVISLVDSLRRQYKGSKAVFFTDEDSKYKGIDVYSLRNVKLKNWNNTSLDLISYSEDNGKLNVLVKITNRSLKNQSREVLLYGENKLLDMKDVDLNKGEERYIYFDEINTDKKYIWAETEEKDSIMEDNKIYSKLGTSKNKKVMLFSKENVFLEKAFSAQKSVKVYKNIDVNNVPSGYDVYIFDGMRPKTLPHKGSFIFINTGNKKIAPMGDLKIVKNPVTKYMNGNFAISKINTENMPSTAEPLVTVGDTTAIAIGKYKGLNAAWINFDLHDSNFPLTQDFPIFANNLLKYFSETNSKVSNINLPENFPSYSESKIGKSNLVNKSDNGLREVEKVNMQKSLRNIFIILALIFMWLEWKVYKNG